MYTRTGDFIRQETTETTSIVVSKLGLESKTELYPSLLTLYKADLIRNINIPWPCKGMGDADYMYAFQHVVMPVAFDFNPDLVLSKSKQQF